MNKMKIWYDLEHLAFQAINQRDEVVFEMLPVGTRVNVSFGDDDLREGVVFAEHGARTPRSKIQGWNLYIGVKMIDDVSDVIDDYWWAMDDEGKLTVYFAGLGEISILDDDE